MKNILTRSGKISVIFACVLLLVVSASAQLSLRKALDFDGDGKADYSVFRPRMSGISTAAAEVLLFSNSVLPILIIRLPAIMTATTKATSQFGAIRTEFGMS
jgi:hypothetical protein